MKTHRPLFLLITLLALVAVQPARAIVGYVNTTFQPGANLFANPLRYTNDNLSFIMPTAPENTSVLTWDPVGMVYHQAAVYSGGAWVGNTLLDPGTGALLMAPSLFTNTFVGDVEDANGGLYDGDTIHLPPAFSGPNGLYLWSSKISASATNASGYSFWEWVVGRAPNDNESFYRWNRSSQTFEGTTFSGGSWNNFNPILDVG